MHAISYGLTDHYPPCLLAAVFFSGVFRLVSSLLRSKLGWEGLVLDQTLCCRVNCVLQRYTKSIRKKIVLLQI